MPVIRNSASASASTSATGSAPRPGLAARRSRPARDVVRLGIDEDRRACSPSSSRNLSIAIYEHNDQVRLPKEQTSELSPLTPPPPSPSPIAASVPIPVSPLPVPTTTARTSAPPESSSVSHSNRISTPISSASTPASAHSSNTSINNPKSHARKREEGHIKRPSNAFILFRTSFVANRLIPSTIESHSQNLSRIAGQVWRGLSAAEKAPWIEKAKEVKKEHEKMHPGYAYHPTESYALRGRRKVLKGRGEREEREARKRCEKIAELVKKGKANDELEKAVQTIEVGSDAMEMEMVSPAKAKKGKPRARRTKQPTSSSSIAVQQPEARAEAEVEEQKLAKATSWPPRDMSLTPPTASVDPTFASVSASFSPAEPSPDSFSSAEPSAGSPTASRSLSVEMLDDMGFDVLGVGVETRTVEVSGEMEVDKGVPPETPGISAERESSGAKENPNPVASSSHPHPHSSRSPHSPPSHSSRSSHSPFSSSYSVPPPPLFNLPNTYIPPGHEDITFVPSFSSIYLSLRPTTTMEGEKGKEKGKEVVRLPPMKVPLEPNDTSSKSTSVSMNTTAIGSSSWSLPAFGTATGTGTAGSNSNFNATKPTAGAFGLPSKVGSSFPGALCVPDKPRLNGFASDASNGSNSRNGGISSWSMNGVMTSPVNANGNKNKNKDGDQNRNTDAGKTNTTINGTRSAFDSGSSHASAGASILPSKVRAFGANVSPSSSTSLASKITTAQRDCQHAPTPPPSAPETPAPRQEQSPSKYHTLRERELDAAPDEQLEEVDPTRFPPRLRLRLRHHHHRRLDVSRPTTTATTTSSSTTTGTGNAVVDDSAALGAAFRRRRDETDRDRDLESESSGREKSCSSGCESEEMCA